LGVLGVAENICLAGVPMLSGSIYDEWNDETGMRAVDAVYLVIGTSFINIGSNCLIHAGTKDLLQPSRIRSSVKLENYALNAYKHPTMFRNNQLITFIAISIILLFSFYIYNSTPIFS
jgi:hypothetical protein